MSSDAYDAQMSPMEAVIFNAMIMESSMLNLRAHFLNHLPDLSPLAGLLTHVKSFLQRPLGKLQSGSW